MFIAIYVKSPAGLIYDNCDEDCKLLRAGTQGKMYAFIQCYQINNISKKKEIKHFWGVYDERSEDTIKNSILNILKQGGECPDFIDFNKIGW